MREIYRTQTTESLWKWYRNQKLGKIRQHVVSFLSIQITKILSYIDFSTDEELPIQFLSQQLLQIIVAHFKEAL